MRRTEQVEYEGQVVTVKELTLEESITLLREIGADTKPPQPEEYLLLGIGRREIRHMSDMDEQTMNAAPLPLMIKVSTACMVLNQDFFGQMVAMGRTLVPQQNTSSASGCDSKELATHLFGDTPSPSVA